MMDNNNIFGSTLDVNFHRLVNAYVDSFTEIRIFFIWENCYIWSKFTHKTQFKFASVIKIICHLEKNAYLVHV